MCAERRGDAIRYGFAVGRVRVLETRLLGRGAYERLLDAPTFADQKRVLSETHFGRFIESADTAIDVERAIDASLSDLYEEFLVSSGLPAPVVEFFRVPHDYSNLKTALKSRLVGDGAAVASDPLGTVPVDEFAGPEVLPGALGETARQLLEGEEPPGAEELDVRIDAAMFAELERCARASKIDVLIRLTRRMIDIANVKVLMRARVAGRSADDTAAMLIAGGDFDAARFAAGRPTPIELASGIVAAGVIKAEPSALEDMTHLDVVCDAALADITRDARRVATGPEPVIAYVLARQAEATSLRALLVGKLVGLDRETVQMRLREAIA